MERLVSLTIRVHDSISQDSPSLQAKLIKAENALTAERALVIQLQRRLSLSSTRVEPNISYDDNTSGLSAELQAAKSQLLTQQVELERLRRRASESEGEISSLREKLKRFESSYSEGRASEVKIRASEDRARVAESMYRDLQHQYDSAAVMVDRLIHENANLTTNCNNQGHQVKTLLVEARKKDATIKALENLMSRGSSRPSLLPDIQEAVKQAFQSLPGLDKLVEDVKQAEGANQQRSSRHRRCSSNMIEGISSDEWKVQALQQEVQVMRQMLEDELKLRGQELHLGDESEATVEGDSQVTSLARTLSMLEAKLEETKLLPLPAPPPPPPASPPLQESSSPPPEDTEAITHSSPLNSNAQPQSAPRKSVSLWGWLMALDVEE